MAIQLDSFGGTLHTHRIITGFDAARLKKLYLGRIIKAHNLLQALTRVNRPFGSYRYGYRPWG